MFKSLKGLGIDRQHIIEKKRKQKKQKKKERKEKNRFNEGTDKHSA